MGNKCTIFVINSEIDKIKMWVEVFEYKVGSFPSSYFGLSLSGKPRAMMFRNLICENIQKRLGVWKKGVFSKVGRLILIRSVLSGILVYYLSLFRPLVLFARLLRSYGRFFLGWGG